MRINDRKYSIIIPKWDNSGRKIRPEILEKVVKRMSEHFGGATVIPSVLGCWKEGDKLICEENAEVYSIRDSESVSDVERQNQIDERFVRDLAKSVANELGQSAVMVTEGIQEVTFIGGRYRKELPQSKVGINWFRRLL